MSALAGGRHSWLPKQHTQVRLETLDVDGLTLCQQHVFAPLVGQRSEVEVGVSSNMIEKFLDVFFWQASQGIDDELGVGRILGAGGGDKGGIAFGASVVGSCGGCLGTTTFAISIVVALSLVDGSASCAYGSTAVTL